MRAASAAPRPRARTARTPSSPSSSARVEQLDRDVPSGRAIAREEGVAERSAAERADQLVAAADNGLGQVNGLGGHALAYNERLRSVDLLLPQRR